MKVSHSASCILLLLAGGFGANAVPEIRITGAESPLIYGISREITCAATGMEVATMRWLLVVAGLELLALSDSNVNELVLNLNPTRGGTDLNGAVFKCVAVDIRGRRHQSFIALSAEDLKHSVNITASSNDAVIAGSSLMLNCTTVTNHVPHMKWVGPNGTAGIQNEEQINGVLKSAILTLDPLLTSHAGNYTCISIIEGNVSTIQAHHFVTVEIPPPNVTLLDSPSVSSQLLNHNYTMTYLLKLSTAVDTPVEVIAQWHGNSSFSNSSTVALTQPAAQPPYYASFNFFPLQQSDMGTYVVTVQAFPTTDNVGAVTNSSEVHVSMFIFIYPSAVVRVSNSSSEEVNKCSVNNGGCEHDCVNTVNSYYCQCRSGYRLSFDERSCTDINECSEGTHNCEHICDNTDGSFTCSCRSEYKLSSDGRSCDDVKKCSTDNGGCQHICINTFQCQCRSGYRLSSNGTNCTDINECFEGNHNCEQMCINTVGSFTCQCNRGYGLSSNGRSCNINECYSNNGGCQHSCVNTDDSYECQCRSGYRLSSNGRSCIDVNECNTNNGGCQHSCINIDGSHVCQCRSGYRQSSDGRTCIDINECSSGTHNCAHVCTNTVGSFTCSCSSGYALAADGQSCNCGSRLITATGSFQTPGWPTSYPQEDLQCEWIIEVPNYNASIEYTIQPPFGINGRPPCSRDYIEFFDGTDSNATSLLKLCRVNIPGPIHTTFAKSKVVFQGSANRYRPQSRVGVKVNYRTV